MKQILILCLLFISSFCYSQLIYTNQVKLVNLTTEQIVSEKIQTNVFIFSDNFITAKYANELVDTYVVISIDTSENVKTYQTIDSNSGIVYFILSQYDIGVIPQEFVIKNYLLVFRKL